MKRSVKLVAPVLLYTARLAGGGPALKGVVGGTSYHAPAAAEAGAVLEAALRHPVRQERWS